MYTIKEPIYLWNLLLLRGRNDRNNVSFFLQDNFFKILPLQNRQGCKLHFYHVEDTYILNPFMKIWIFTKSSELCVVVTVESLAPFTLRLCFMSSHKSINLIESINSRGYNFILFLLLKWTYHTKIKILLFKDKH